MVLTGSACLCVLIYICLPAFMSMYAHNHTQSLALTLTSDLHTLMVLSAEAEYSRSAPPHLTQVTLSEWAVRITRQRAVNVSHILTVVSWYAHTAFQFYSLYEKTTQNKKNMFFQWIKNCIFTALSCTGTKILKKKKKNDFHRYPQLAIGKPAS